MHSPSILYPVFALVAWTFVVLLAVAGLRLTSKVHPSHFALGESEKVPLRARLANRNYMNLLELPMLFYAVCVLLYSANAASGTAVQLAWVYVILRIVHSVVHISYNNVIHRLLAFATGNFVLMGLWISAWNALAP